MFVPLQVMSTYSLLQSTNRIPELVQTAKDRGYTTLALTDKNVMYGVVAFYNACRAADIKPILGLTLTTQAIGDATQPAELVFLARDFTGYQQLMQLSTAYQVAAAPVDLSQQTANLTHLDVIVPLNSEVHQLLEIEDVPAAVQTVQQLQQWAPERVAVGISPDLPTTRQHQLAQLQEATQAPLVGLSPVEYLDREDHFAVTVLRAIDAGAVIEDLPAAQATLGTHWLRPAAAT